MSHCPCSRIFVASVLSFVSLALAAQAQTVLYADDSAAGANDGSSWCDAFAELQDALSAAADSGGVVTEIRTASGIHHPDIDDIICIIDGFAAGETWPNVCPNGDHATTSPPDCGRDGQINLDDIIAVLEAFAGNPPCSPPCP